MKHPLIFSGIAAAILGTSLAFFIIGILRNDFWLALPFIFLALGAIAYQRMRAYRIDKMKKEYYKKMNPPK
jgi:hypothetical protein